VLKLIAMVAIGGAAGSVARYLLAGQISTLFGGAFPWGVLAVNVIGCTAMGALAELAALVWSPSPEVRALLMVGVLGGFTTFSSFALDTFFLLGRGAPVSSFAYVAGSVLLSLAGFFAAQYVVRTLV
jgi:CrcB protein